MAYQNTVYAFKETLRKYDLLMQRPINISLNYVNNKQLIIFDKIASVLLFVQLIEQFGISLKLRIVQMCRVSQQRSLTIFERLEIRYMEGFAFVVISKKNPSAGIRMVFFLISVVPEVITNSLISN